jgi:signal transduction histidine kinase
VLFALLSLYIVLQFSWWAVLLLRKDQEVHQLAEQVQLLGGSPGDHGDAERGARMIMGEAVVFLTLLILLLVLTFRAVKRDLALARTQRNFLLAVTHELRTPIAAIKLQLQTLAREGLKPDQQATLRATAVNEADRLALLTDKVLMATKADDDLMPLELAQVDVLATLNGVIDRARTHIARAHHIRSVVPGTLTVKSDEQALRSIADNLVENAAKYAPAGTTITMTVEDARDHWRLQVSDEGPGIPGPEHQRIFEKFYRGGSEETRSAKGTGLGLYIVHRLVTRLGGTITVRTGADRGATFTASFPKR